VRTLTLKKALELYPKLLEIIPCTSPDGGISRRHKHQIESVTEMHIDEPNVILEYYDDDMLHRMDLGSDVVMDHMVSHHTIAVCHRLSRPTQYLNIQGYGIDHEDVKSRTQPKSLWDALLDIQDFDYVVVFTSITDERTRSRWDDYQADYSASWSEGVKEHWDIEIILPPEGSIYRTLWGRRGNLIRDPREKSKSPFENLRTLIGN
jgi:hypothetical protein